MNSIIDNFKTVYSTLGADHIDVIGDIYDERITFIDPFHEIRGLDKLIEYFSSLYSNVESCQFTFHNVFENGNSAMVTWRMTLRHRSLSRDVIEVPGATEIRFGNKIFYHHDFFDAGKMIYENVILLGSLVKYVKNRI